jgi:hypothetical protein
MVPNNSHQWALINLNQWRLFHVPYGIIAPAIL